MTMKLEISDSQSNHSDFSCDSQSSQESSNNDYVSAVPASRSLLTLANLEGLQSGVPTRTTATITPTQLRNFEQTYIELSNCRTEPNHAGFIPPSVMHANNYGILNQTGYGEGPTTALQVSPGPFSASGDSSSSPGLPAPKRRNMGGRRPTKAPQDISPEEEERRKVRRERNKQAAARCRKRRLDHTNDLQGETDILERKKQALKDEVNKLVADRDRLETILQSHMHTCRLIKRSISPPDVKPFQEHNYGYTDLAEEVVRVKVEVMEHGPDPVLTIADNDVIYNPEPIDKKVMLSQAAMVGPPCITLDTPPIRANRPSFLHVPLTVTPAQIHNNKALGGKQIAGVEISTPSNGIPFNFESLMEGGTGLTPVHPPAHPLPPVCPTACPTSCAPACPAPCRAPTHDTHDHNSLVSL